MYLPNAENAEVTEEKITGYLLDPLHPDGASKAKFFSSLGFTRKDWRILAEALCQMAMESPIKSHMESSHGWKYVIEGDLETPLGTKPFVRTVWIVDAGEAVPRLVTAYPCDRGD